MTASILNFASIAVCLPNRSALYEAAEKFMDKHEARLHKAADKSEAEVGTSNEGEL